MVLSCSYIPKRNGKELKEFSNYRKELGYKTAAKVFTQAISPAFQKDFKKYVKLDEQNVPTYDSVIKIPYIKKIVGKEVLKAKDQNKYKSVEDNSDNYKLLLREAYNYNTNSDNADSFVAVVVPYKDGIRVEIRDRNDENTKLFEDQYCTNALNEKLVTLLGIPGITVTELENMERTNGYVDFSKAKDIANGFKGLINIAKGIKGQQALPEEVAHILVGAFKDSPIIQRCLAQLANNDNLLQEVLRDKYQDYYEYYYTDPNYDEDGNEVPIEEAMAEEALGQILRDKLLDTFKEESDDNSTALNRLVNRLINWIKNIFKGKDPNDINKILNDVNLNMGKLAKDFLNQDKKLTEKNIMNSARQAKFNELSDAIDDIVKLLKDVKNIERKKFKVFEGELSEEARSRILKLEACLSDKEKLTGLMQYAAWAVKDIKSATETLDALQGSSEVVFKEYLNIRMVLDSYSNFIKELHDILDNINDEDATVILDGEERNIKKLWMDLNDVNATCLHKFSEKALTSFCDYLAPIYNKNPLRDKNGKVRNIRDVLTGEQPDISEFDRWLTTMGTSSNIILQMYDHIVKGARHEARQKTIIDISDIRKLQEDGEKLGITSFEWAYEKDNEGHKTGYYISKYNRGQYEKDKKEFKEKLLEKYGKNPSGEAVKEMLQERNEWLKTHTVEDTLGNYYPSDKYLNSDYAKLSKDKKEYLDRILEFKRKIEELLPDNKRDVLRAIQRRRTNAQRILDSLKNPSQAYESIVDDIQSIFSHDADDDLLYGEPTEESKNLLYGEPTQELRDFRGQEYMTLPILYTNKLKNPDTLSTDLISDLTAYAYMANVYHAINKVQAALEVGSRLIPKDSFKKSDNKGFTEEVLHTMGKVTKNHISIGDGYNFGKKLRDFMECQVYGRYYKKDDILGQNAQKTIGFFQKLSSLAYIGCNYLGGIANVATAVGMQNIEAAAGEFFGPKELAKADTLYAKLMPAFMSNITNRYKDDKLSLFDNFFNVKQNFKDKAHNVKSKNLVRRLFGQNWAFVQQGLGDHWIYNRTALAMALREKVKVNGVETSLWDALEIVTDKNGYNKIQLKSGTRNLDGTLFNTGDFSDKIAHINHTLIGVYNDEDMIAAQRVIFGRLLLQMRQWIVPQMMRRFQKKRMVIAIGREEEGYYRTVARLAKDIWKSGFKITSEWNNLSKSEKQNVIRAFTEIVQATCVWLLATGLASGAKDPDKIWAMKLAEYLAYREAHELGFLAAGPTMLSEGLQTLNDPFVVASATSKVAQVILTTVNPLNWNMDEDHLIQTGKYKGHSYIYKRWMELPLPFLSQWDQIDKFAEDLDAAGLYYKRGYK